MSVIRDPQTPNPDPRSSDADAQTSNLEPRTSSLLQTPNLPLSPNPDPRSSDVDSQTSNLEPRTPNLPLSPSPEPILDRPKPKITIITPTYNAESTIEACILSVATQTFPGKEHLIIDGASTDATLATVRKYVTKYPHIRFISEPDNGIYDAMNKGIAQANGEWLYFLGSDDLFYEDGVLEQIFNSSVIDACDLVYGNVLWGDTGTFYDGEFTLPKLMEQNICHQAIVYKKSLFDRLGFFDVSYRVWADYLFNIRAFTTKNIIIRYLDIVIARFAFSGASSIAVVDTDFLRDREIIYGDCFSAELVECYQKLQGLTQEITSLKLQLSERDRQLSERDYQLAELGHQLAARDHQLAERGQQLSERNWQVGELNVRLDLALKKLQNLDQSLADMQQSFCWRLTQPVRTIADALRGAKQTGVGSAASQGVDYDQWVACHDTCGKQDLEAIDRRVGYLQNKPLISIVMPVYNIGEKWLRRTLDSVLAQRYPVWELCIADDASTEPHVRAVLNEYRGRDERIRVVFRQDNGHISRASNSALELATGEFVVMLDHDDELSAHALYFLAQAVNDNPGSEFLYSDDDKLDQDGHRCLPFFKPDWSPHLLFSQCYPGHLVCIKADLLRELGGFREGFEGAQDYDLLLRITEKARNIVHIPKVLYHWRLHPESTSLSHESKPYAHIAGSRALTESLRRRYERFVRVDDGVYPFTYQPRFVLESDRKFTIIIPTKDKIDYLRLCIDSIFSESTWRNFEILILNNNSEKPETFAYFESLSSCDNVRVLDLDMPFNWSRLNNAGAAASQGDMLVFLNNDTRVIAKDWLERLGEYALLPEVACVGALLLYEDGTIQHDGVVVGMMQWAEHVFKGMSPVHFPSPFVSPMCTRDVMAVTGACMAIERDTFNLLGGFDESFMICGSDVELGLRAHGKGYFNVQCVEARLFHLESRSRNPADVPAGDFTESAKKYAPYRLEQVDPFFNPNLDLMSTTPQPRRQSE